MILLLGYLQQILSANSTDWTAHMIAIVTCFILARLILCGNTSILMLMHVRYLR